MKNDKTLVKRTRSEISDEIIQLKQQLPEPVSAPRLFSNDITAEALQSVLATQNGRYSLISDEGNFFDIFGGLYNDGKCNLDTVLKGHAGGTLRIDRQGRPSVHISKVALSVGLAVQPQVLNDISKGSKRGFRGKGMLARFNYCFPKSTIGTRDVRKRKSIPANIKARFHQGMKTLLDTATRINTAGGQVPVVLNLSKDALAEWEDYQEWIESRQGEGGEFESIQDFTGKQAGQVLRISGLCHASDQLFGQDKLSSFSTSSTLSSQGNPNEISVDTLRPVIALSKKLIVHAQAAFDQMEDDGGISDAKVALKWIKTHCEKDDQGAFFFKQSALHSCSRFKNSKLERVLKALNILQERRMISTRFSLPTKKPTFIYYVNPVLMK